jgi:flavin-dependent dehydrogenase
VSVDKVDVAILGGGFAGSLLARQLKRRLPELEVVLLEKSTQRSFKVGESVVEIGASYLLRRQGLSRYLYDRHYPKNGLRYFFDSPERDLPLERMSEIGPIHFPFHPGFQLDRSRIEADLLEMNRAAGVRVLEGTPVRRVRLGEPGKPHRIEAGGAAHAPFEARWVIDASGRAELLARQLGLRVREDHHRIGSVWARFEDVADVDELGPPEFRARVRWSTRALSTVHFWYPGYWIWFIPLRNGVTSVGLVGERARDPSLVSPEGLCVGLRAHRGAATLLEGAKPVDLGAYRQIAYGTRRFFDAGARFGLCGEAASAADPLYSPGTDFIALENDFLTDLIARELRGESPAQLAERGELYDAFMQFRHEATLRLYRGLYGGLGSYELMRIKWDFDIASYYNLWLSAYLQDLHLNRRWLQRQLRMRDFVLRALDQFGDLFQRLERTLLNEGRYFLGNQGRFSYGLEHIDFVERVGEPRSDREVLEKSAQIFNHVHRSVLELLDARGAGGRAPLPLAAFVGPDPLV